MLVSLENDDGIGPLKPALSIYSSSSLTRFPNSEGREPFKLFVPKHLKPNNNNKNVSSRQNSRLEFPYSGSMNISRRAAFPNRS